jgi:hypothetical protein
VKIAFNFWLSSSEKLMKIIIFVNIQPKYQEQNVLIVTEERVIVFRVTGVRVTGVRVIRVRVIGAQVTGVRVTEVMVTEVMVIRLELLR